MKLVYKYRNLAHLFEECARHEPDPARDNDNHYKKGFHKTKNIEEYKDIAFSGWKFTKAEQRKIEALAAPASSDNVLTNVFTPTPVLAVAGGAVDVGAYLGGEINCFQAWEEQERPAVNRVINIDVDLAVGFPVKHTEVNKLMFEVLSAIIILELQGYSVGVNACVYTEDCDNTEVDLIVPVKDAGESLNASRLYAAINVDFLRRGFFHLSSRMPELKVLRGLACRIVKEPNVLGFYTINGMTGAEIADLILKQNKI